MIKNKNKKLRRMIQSANQKPQEWKTSVILVSISKADHNDYAFTPSAGKV